MEEGNGAKPTNDGNDSGQIYSKVLFNRLIAQICPWKFRAYRGKIRAIAGVLGINHKQAVYYSGEGLGPNMVPGYVAGIICEILKRRIENLQGLLVDWEGYLERVTKRDRKVRVAHGFCVVKERDGKGSEPRDGRWRGGSTPVSYTHLTLPTVYSV